MWKLYGSHASPLTRIVQGIPTSWNPSIATKKTPSDIQTVAWSPCSRLIAIAYSSYPTIVEVLDAMTFKQHIGFRSLDQLQHLTFSPDTHLLTCVERDAVNLISWDLQTGVSVSTISLELEKDTVKSLTYSPCGTMVGVLSLSAGTAMICTYNILSGTNMCSHSVQGPVLNKIWTDGENIQFATFEPGTITIWGVGFVSEHLAVKVKSLPIPDDFDPSMGYIFPPTLSWLVYYLENMAAVWDTHHSELITGFDADTPCSIDASNGHLFTCTSDDREISVWKESPTGYIFHQNIIFSSTMCSPLLHPHLSPDGESIVVSHGSALQLLDITDPFIEVFRSADPFIVEFSLDESLAVTAREGDWEARVLDLKSGIPQLTIDTGMGVHLLKIAGSSINVIGMDRIVTWNLPERNHILNARVDINDSVQTTTFNCTSLLGSLFTPAASISPDLSYIATVKLLEFSLKIYEISTGEYIGSVESVAGDRLWFTPNEQEVWCNTNNGVKGWEIVKSDLLGQVELQPIEHQPEGYPWKSSSGYEVTHDGWVLSPSGKQLLWLPPHWQSKEIHRQWNGQFLALLHPDLPEIVILEFPEE